MPQRFFHKILTVLATGIILAGMNSCKEEKPASKETIPPAIAANTAEKPSKKPVTEAILALNYEGTLDMGKVYETEMKEGSFLVTNVSKIPQEIHSVTPTCECITLDKDYSDTCLQPGESLEIKFIMDALTVKLNSYRRFIQITTHSGFTLKAAVGGWIVKLAQITPRRVADLGPMKNPAQSWTQIFEITGNAELPEQLTFGELPEHPLFNCKLEDKGNGKYTLTVTPKKALPYSRDFHSLIDLPVLKPAEAKHLPLWLKAQVAEAVNFAPDKWEIVKDKLEAAGSFTETFAYGEVPGVLEEKNDASKDLKNMMSVSLLRQHNAIPLKFVKEHHDWNDLFAHLDFQVPDGVVLEKIRHPQGIALKLTVKKEAFPQGINEIQVIPMRDGNKFAPISIRLLD